MILASIHVAAVLFYRFAKHTNLIFKPMVLVLLIYRQQITQPEKLHLKAWIGLKYWGWGVCDFNIDTSW